MDCVSNISPWIFCNDNIFSVFDADDEESNMTQAKTTEEIGKKWNGMWFVNDNIRLRIPYQKRLAKLEQKKWLPADNAVLIEDVEKMVEELVDFVIDDKFDKYTYKGAGKLKQIDILKQKLNSLKGK